MKGLIAVSCSADLARYTDFYRVLLELKKPVGTTTKLFPGFFSYHNKMNAVKEVLLKDYDWVFFLDDDQILPPDTLLKLLEDDLPVVTCNLLYRNPPFNPYLFNFINDNGATAEVLTDQKELLKIEACGAGGLLVKTAVFKILPSPCFDIDLKLRTEDLYFCNLLKKYNVPLYCDLNAVSGHIVSSVVWPNKIEGKWQTTLVINNMITLNIPAASKKENNLVIEGDLVKGNNIVSE